MKKLIILLSVISLCFSLTLSVTAEDTWGSYDEGIIPTCNNYPPLHTPYKGEGGLPNFDFEEGLKYWSCGSGRAPTDVVKLCQEENGNTYIQLDGEIKGEGIESVSFKENRISEGDELCILYSWRGDNPNFEIYCFQILYKTADFSQYEKQYVTWTGDARRSEIIVGEDGGWNIAYCRFDQLVKAPYPAVPDYYFNLGVMNYDKNCDAQIDNVILAKRNSQTDVIYSLDGEVLYDLRNFKVEEQDEEIDASRIPELDFSITYDDIYGEKQSLSSSDISVSPAIIAIDFALIGISVTAAIIVKNRRKAK